MTSKYIIIEGPDNVGKDTQVNLIIKNNPKRAFHHIHYSKLPFTGVEQVIKYSNKLYTNMFKFMKTLRKKNYNIIFNRSHLGESVYAPLYRGYSGDYVFNIEKQFINTLKDNLYLIVLVDDASSILKRDDGKSYYTDIKHVQGEVDKFTRAYRKSQIKNKLLINIRGMNPLEVSEVIHEFINSEYTEAPDNQLKLEI